jgi:hypothetical protein
MPLPPVPAGVGVVAQLALALVGGGKEWVSRAEEEERLTAAGMPYFDAFVASYKVPARRCAIIYCAEQEDGCLVCFSHLLDILRGYGE